MPQRDRLRVAVFTYGVQPRGGVVHALSLTEALVAHGHDAVLFAIDESGRGLFREPRCPVSYVSVEPRHDGDDIVDFVRRRIDAIVAAYGPAMHGFDVYHAHDGIGGNALATIAASGAIAGYVRTVHHIDDFADPTLATLQDLSIINADRCFTVSALWQRALAERFDIAAELVPNGVDPARFFAIEPAAREVCRARLGLADDPFFVSIGGVEARKNTLAIVEAFALVHAEKPGARLTIAGGASVFDHGPYRRAVDEHLAELGLGVGTDAVLTGPVPDDEILTLLHAADALVFPSLLEGFGLVVLEALACGTPVVVSDAAPFTEFLGPDDAVFVDPHDPADIARGMARACEPATARALRAGGSAIAARRTWDASAIVHAERYRAYLVERDNIRA